MGGLKLPPMKTLKALATIFIALSFSHFAHAEEAEPTFRLACSDEEPTIGIVIREVPEDHVAVGEIFSFKGMAAVNTAVSMLPEYLRFEWPFENCKKTEAYVMKCEGSSDVQIIDGHRVEPISVESASTPFLNAFQRDLTFKLKVDGKPYELHTTFSEKQCTDKAVF